MTREREVLYRDCSRDIGEGGPSEEGCRKREGFTTRTGEPFGGGRGGKTTDRHGIGDGSTSSGLLGSRSKTELKKAGLVKNAYGDCVGAEPPALWTMSRSHGVFEEAGNNIPEADTQKPRRGKLSWGASQNLVIYHRRRERFLGMKIISLNLKKPKPRS